MGLGALGNLYSQFYEFNSAPVDFRNNSINCELKTKLNSGKRMPVMLLSIWENIMSTGANGDLGGQAVDARADGYQAFNAGAGFVHIGDLCGVDDLITGPDQAGEGGLVDFCEDDFFFELPRGRRPGCRQFGPCPRS